MTLLSKNISQILILRENILRCQIAFEHPWLVSEQIDYGERYQFIFRISLHRYTFNEHDRSKKSVKKKQAKDNFMGSISLNSHDDIHSVATVGLNTEFLGSG